MPNHSRYSLPSRLAKEKQNYFLGFRNGSTKSNLLEMTTPKILAQGWKDMLSSYLANNLRLFLQRLPFHHLFSNLNCPPNLRFYFSTQLLHIMYYQPFPTVLEVCICLRNLRRQIVGIL